MNQSRLFAILMLVIRVALAPLRFTAMVVIEFAIGLAIGCREGLEDHRRMRSAQLRQKKAPTPRLHKRHFLLGPKEP